MLGDFLGFVAFVVVVYLLAKTFLKEVVPGVSDGLLFFVKLILKIAIFPFCLVAELVKLILGGNRSKVVGVARERITITDRYVDRKGRTVRVDKTIDMGARTVTKRDLNRIR